MIDYRFSVIDYRLSITVGIIDYRLLIVDYRFSIIDSRLSIIDCTFSATDDYYRLSIYRLLGPANRSENAIEIKLAAEKPNRSNLFNVSARLNFERERAGEAIPDQPSPASDGV